MAETKQTPTRREKPTLANEGSIPRSGLRIPMPATTKPPATTSSSRPSPQK